MILRSTLPLSVCALFFASGCIEFHGGPTGALSGTQGEVGGTLGARIFDYGIGHFYNPIRPVVGIAGNATFATRSVRQLTVGPEIGLDNYWTDAERGDWSFRGVFVRGETGFHTDAPHGSSGRIDYFGGGATILFRLGGSDTMSWGIDAAAGRRSGRDDRGGFDGTTSVLIAWP